MPDRKKLIIGNWKMNMNVHDSSLYLHQLSKLVKVHRDVEMVIAPSMIALQTLSLQVNLKQFKLAAQNFFWRDSGPYTGEVSATQLRGIVQYAIIGHSERRYVFNETPRDIRNKVEAAIRNEITPVLCIGETAWEHAAEETQDVLRDELVSGLANITSEDVANVVIAYEPVWAISAGLNSKPIIVSPSEVSAAINGIRRELKHLFGETVSKEIRVLYGGSVTTDSVADYMALPGVDGLLVGGSSLSANMFNEIIEKAHKKTEKIEVS